MKSQHVPAIDTRYWLAITLASVFGTNLGDFYAHQSGLGLLGGLPILIALFIVVYAVERYDERRHEAYYWLCIIILRTGATNIADYMAGRRGLNLDRTALSALLCLALAGFAWWSGRVGLRPAPGGRVPGSVPATSTRYWIAMLTAGVLGTVLGDLIERLIGQAPAAMALSAVLIVALAIYRRVVLPAVYAYWLTIGVARTSGTAIGDWLAENKVLNIGLARCTVLTGAAFVAVLLLWRSRRPVARARTA